MYCHRFTYTYTLSSSGRGEQSQGSEAGEQGDKLHTSFFFIMHYRVKKGANLYLKLYSVKPVWRR